MERERLVRGYRGERERELKVHFKRAAAPILRPPLTRKMKSQWEMRHAIQSSRTIRRGGGGEVMAICIINHFIVWWISCWGKGEVGDFDNTS